MSAASLAPQNMPHQSETCSRSTIHSRCIFSLTPPSLCVSGISGNQSAHSRHPTATIHHSRQAGRCRTVISSLSLPFSFPRSFTRSRRTVSAQRGAESAAGTRREQRQCAHRQTNHLPAIRKQARGHYSSDRSHKPGSGAQVGSALCTQEHERGKRRNQLSTAATRDLRPS